MANQVDIIIRAVEKGVATTFSRLTSGLKSGKLAMDAFNATMGRTNAVAGAMQGRLTAAFGAIASGAAVKNLWEAGVASQQLGLAFTAIAGSAKGGADELAFLRAESERLGLVFPTVADSYKKIFAAAETANIPLADTRMIFSGLTEGFVALGLEGERVKLALQAVSQMMGKNQVMAEELKQQLGEHFPVAIGYFAQAADVSVAKFFEMMKNGEVTVETLKKASQLISKDFGAAATKAADQAVGSLGRFQTAWWDLKVLIADSGFLDAATQALKTMTAAMKDPQVQAEVKKWSAAFFDLAAKVVAAAWEYKQLVVGVLASVVAVKVVSALVTVVIALRVAFTALTGMSVATWFSTAAAGMSTAAIAAGGLKTAIGAMFGVFLAWDLGQIVGGWLLHFDAVKKAGISMAAGLTKAWIRAKIAWASLTSSDTSALRRELAEADRLFGEMFADVGQGAKKAVEAQKQVSTATEEAARKSKTYTSRATDAMRDKWKEYADAVKELQKGIADKQLELTRKLRELGREGMTDIGAYRDQEREAGESLKASKKLFEEARKAMTGAQGALSAEEEARITKLVESAKQAAARAEELYNSLPNTVEQDDKVVVSLREGLATRTEGIKAAVKLWIDESKALEEFVKQTARAMDEKVGGDLTRDLPELAKGFEGVVDQAKLLKEQAAEFKAGWMRAWAEFIRTGSEAVDKLEEALNKVARDRNIVVRVRQVEERFFGGMIERLRAGGFPRRQGKLPGNDGPDGIRALLAPGEFIVRSAAVRKYGAALFYALNSLRLDLGAIIGPKIAGAMRNIQVPSLAPVRMYSGGLAPAGAAGPGTVFNLNATFVGTVSPMSRVTARDNAKAMLTEFERLYRGRS